MSTDSKIVVLLTDFGLRDGYPGIMKGAILTQDPGIRIVDLTHDIDPYDPLSAAYVLFTAWEHFPPGSVFCAVVDPGVGSRRRALVAEIAARYLVAPDNGLISLLFRMYAKVFVYALRTDRVLELQHESRRALGIPTGGQPTASGTFHGRDLFAPAAALCALGAVKQIRGGRIQPVLLPAVLPEHGNRVVRGQILHIDRFGNCISSLHSRDLDVLGPKRGKLSGIVVQAGTFQDHSIRETYSDVSAGAPLCLIGSSGFLEIAVREGSAAQRFGFSRGQTLTVAAVEP